MSSRLGVRDRHLRNPLDTPSVINRAILAPQFPTMTMIGIFAKTDIARNDEIREGLPDELGRENDGGAGVVRRRAASVFEHVEGNSEENH